MKTDESAHPQFSYDNERVWRQSISFLCLCLFICSFFLISGIFLSPLSVFLLVQQRERKAASLFLSIADYCREGNCRRQCPVETELLICRRCLPGRVGHLSAVAGPGSLTIDSHSYIFRCALHHNPMKSHRRLPGSLASEQNWFSPSRSSDGSITKKKKYLF